jgi:hypothetical protein
MEKIIGIVYILLGIGLHFITNPTHNYILWVLPQIGLIVIGMIKLYKSINLTNS